MLEVILSQWASFLLCHLPLAELGEVVKQTAQIILKNSASLLYVFRNGLRLKLHFWILGFTTWNGCSQKHFSRSLKIIVQLSLQHRLIVCGSCSWCSSVLFVTFISQLVTVLFRQCGRPRNNRKNEGESELCKAGTYSGQRNGRTDFSWTNAEHISTPKKLHLPAVLWVKVLKYLHFGLGRARHGEGELICSAVRLGQEVGIELILVFVLEDLEETEEVDKRQVIDAASRRNSVWTLCFFYISQYMSHAVESWGLK